MHNGHDERARALSALQHLDPGCSRDDWHRIGRAAIAAGLTIDDLDAWSSAAPNYAGSRDVTAAFRTVTPEGGTGPGSLYFMAKAEGWRDAPGQPAPMRPSAAPARPVEAPKRPRPGMGAAEVWARLEPAPADHGYIVAKQGMPDGLRVVPEGDPLVIAGQRMAGALAVPVLPLTGGQPVSLQFIPPPGAGRKLNLPGAPMSGTFIVGELQPGGTAFIVEGVGQAWAVWRATGRPAVVTFGAGRFRAVAAELRQLDASARLVLVPDVGKETDAQRIAADVGAAVARMPDGWAANADVNDLAQRDGFDALEALLAGAADPPKPALPFALVPIADLAETDPPPPEWVLHGWVPAGHVTLLAAHGGTGKSMLGLMLMVAVALGLPLFGVPTRRGKVAFFSGEDGAALLRYRLRLVCRCMGVRVEDLDGRVFILDATDHDPTLFTEVAAGGRREGVVTDAFARLREFMAAEDVSLLVVDNASDVFDASEIDRARVRGFMRALARIARERNAGVLLLAHVDKLTSRGDRGPNPEGYSGSTAWHNSARSRLFMAREKDGALLLRHEKCNLGPLREPLRLIWPSDGIPTLDAPLSGTVRGIAEQNDTRALLRLIDEFSARGEFVSAATTSRTHAGKLLRGQPGFPPRMHDHELFDLLRVAERRGLLARVDYKGADRKLRERWEVTPEGRRSVGLAATAATSRDFDVTAHPAGDAEPAATAATSPPGGVGGKSAHNSRSGAPA